MKLLTSQVSFEISVGEVARGIPLIVPNSALHADRQNILRMHAMSFPEKAEKVTIDSIQECRNLDMQSTVGYGLHFLGSEDLLLD